jgi:hypothetical protein
MSRELILIPKLKYERLMNDVKQARKDDEEKEHSTADTIQSATDKKLSNHDKQSPPKGKSVDKQSFIRMKPEQFLQPKKRVKTAKQKWVTFHI